MIVEEINDRKIVESCQKGGLDEFGKLYDKYVKKIYDFIYYKSYHKETAEDLTSQTFIKALDNIKTFRSDKGSFASWLYRIARNNVIDYYRKKERGNVDIYDFWGLASEENIAYDIDVKEKLGQVESYLKKLNGEQREIVIMKIWNGLSYKEISGVIGKSEASCKMTFSRTMAKLRKEIPLALFFLLLFKILNQ